ncbi:MAG: NAD(P)H-hydrate dehydratase [Gammaproteobacteria bacterium]|nr:MAG: NAD(P)H-hydrate dehydratase [Gammaproteobacteria bacterium]
MSSLPVDLYRADQVRALDRRIIEQHAITGFQLMERAAASAWQELVGAWPEARRITVLCGSGNNAGDGFLLAGLAHDSGRKVRLITLTDPENLAGDANRAARLTLGRIQTKPFLGSDQLTDADVLVDAMLGTGLDRALEGNYLQAVKAINAAGRPVLAIDIPTGLHADSGRVMGDAVQATLTVTFIGLKQGMFTGCAADYCGRIVFADLDAPEEIYSAVPPAARRIDYASQASLLSPRRRTAHKGSYGHVLVVGGDYGYSGAVRMAATAAARCGAGLISVATRCGHANAIPLAVPELMVRGIEQSAELDPMLSRASLVVAGPGLGQDDWGQRLFTKILDSALPLVLDADALNLLAREPARSNRWILTPHPGEAARLLDLDAAAVQADRFQAIEMLQARYGGVIVLKGSGTIVYGGAGLPMVCTDGNPGMASGGMGDVLSGVIAGLLVQWLSPLQAAALGVAIHAAAGDRAARQDGERGMLATDLLPWIRRLVNPMHDSPVKQCE